MKEVYEIISTLQIISGTNAKIDYLNKFKSNNDLKEYLKLTYDIANHNFFQSEITKVVVQPDTILVELSINDFKEIAKIHSTREITGNEAINDLSLEWKCAISEDKKLLEWMIERDIKAGVNRTTINKIWPGLCLVVPYMRCDLPKNTDYTKWPWKEGVFSQLKCDGMFININNSNNIQISSRSGSQFPLSRVFDDLMKDISKLPKNYQYHGELLIYDYLLKGPIPREQSNGLLNSILQGETNIYSGYYIKAILWDMIPLSESKSKGKYNVPYKTRFRQLSEALVNMEVLELVPTSVVFSFEEALKHYKQMLSSGNEGTVIKNPYGIWKDGTSKDQLKLKLTCSIDLEIVGFNPGTGKFANTFGSIVCASSDKQLYVGVSGMPDSIRNHIWENKDTYSGKIIEVIANGIMTPNKNSEQPYSLFLPRLGSNITFVRQDKHIADDLERIKSIFESAIQA